jgi:hypothetical protein
MAPQTSKMFSILNSVISNILHKTNSISNDGSGNITLNGIVSQNQKYKVNIIDESYMATAEETGSINFFTTAGTFYLPEAPPIGTYFKIYVKTVPGGEGNIKINRNSDESSDMIYGKIICSDEVISVTNGYSIFINVSNCNIGDYAECVYAGSGIWMINMYVFTVSANVIVYVIT